jgi:hypothetical protein
MKTLPKTETALMLRTDFSDDAAWAAVCEAIREPVGDFRAFVDCVSDLAYDGRLPDQLVVLAAGGFDQMVAFLVDRTTLTHPERPVLVVDLSEEPGRTFRVIPRELWGVENNLSIANMDFAEFGDNVDANGIFRGFLET